MATLILRDTYRALEREMESLDKLKRETSAKIRDAALKIKSLMLASNYLLNKLIF